MTRSIRTTLQYEIDVPREKVFAFRLDCTNLPSVNAAISNVRRTRGSGKPAAGTQYVCDCKLDWGESTATVNLEEVVEPSLIVLDMYSDSLGTERIGSKETARFTETASGGTRIEVELTMNAPEEMPNEAFELMREHAADPIHVELSAMKQLLESESKPVQ